MTNKTGPVKIGDHWPGIYITGQDALIRIYCDVRHAMRRLEVANDMDPHPSTQSAIRGLLELLQLFDSCEVNQMKRLGIEPLLLEVKEP